MKNKTINILEDNRGNILMTLGTGKDLIQTQNENLNENVIIPTALIFRISVLKNMS